MRTNRFDSIEGPVVISFEGGFHFGEEKKTAGGKIGTVRKVENRYNAIFCQELGNHVEGVRWRVVMIKLN